MVADMTRGEFANKFAAPNKCRGAALMLTFYQVWCVWFALPVVVRHFVYPACGGSYDEW
jgi:hypothetical protein